MKLKQNFKFKVLFPFSVDVVLSFLFMEFVFGTVICVDVIDWIMMTWRMVCVLNVLGV